MLVIQFVVSARNHRTIPPKSLQLLVVAGFIALPSLIFSQSSDQPISAVSPAIAREYGKLPLAFEPSAQVSGAFIAQTAGAKVQIDSDQLQLRVYAPGRDQSDQAQLHLVRSNWAAAAKAEKLLPGTSSYFSGSDPHKWRTNIPNYAQVTYTGVYPGIDLTYYGNRSGRLEHDFVVHPGGDPALIRLSLTGVSGAHLSSKGEITGSLGPATITLDAPVVYQEVAGVRHAIQSSYVLQNHQISFALGKYDPARDLVIDPVLDYSTYMGAGILTAGYAIAVDSEGNAYIVGHAGVGGSFPHTKGAYGSSCDSCAFVAKLNSTGTALTYSAYLEGGLYDQANAVAVDKSGNAYVAGLTESSSFPTTSGVVQPKFGGGFSNGFLTKLNSTGTSLLYSTYLGGNGPSTCYSSAVGSRGDQINAIAIDGSGNAYVTGCTSSTNFPVTKGAYKTYCEGCDNNFGSPFVTKLNSTATEKLYSTYLGGNGLDWGYGIQVDSEGNAYIAGTTTSTDLKTSSNAYQKHLNASGGQNAFVTKLNSSGNALVYQTYLGGSVVDGALALALDSSGDTYIAGYAESADFPVTKGAAQTKCPACEAGFGDGFVTKLNSSGSALVYSTFLGGSGNDVISGIAVKPAGGDAFVTGLSQSTDYPVTSSALKKTCSQCSSNPDTGGESSAVFTEVGYLGTQLLYSTYLSGSGSDAGYAIALDSSGNAYLTGQAGSTNFPVSAGAYDLSCGSCSTGNTAAYVTKFYFGSSTPTVTLSPISLSFGNEAEGHTTSSKSVKLTNTGEGPLQPTSFQVTGADPKDFGGSENCHSAVPPGLSCTIEVAFDPTALGSRTADVSISDNATNSPQKVALSGTGVPPEPAISFSPSPLNFGYVALNQPAFAQLKISNTGTATLDLEKFSISPSNETEFGASSDCNSTLSPGSSCDLTFEFIPSSNGLQSVTLSVTDNASGSPQKVTVEGTGAPDNPVVSLSATTLSFGTESVGHSSASKSVTLTNKGGEQLIFTGLSITGTDPKDFSGTSNCPSPLNPGLSCSVTITFKPTAKGSRSALLEFADNASGSPQKVTLTGTGD